MNALLQEPKDFYVPQLLDDAARLLRSAPSEVPSAKTIRPLGFLSFVFLYVGARDRALEGFEVYANGGYLTPFFYTIIWHPEYAALRKTERFKTLVRKMGLVEYWRARGWPDVCHPTTGDDFSCE